MKKTGAWLAVYALEQIGVKFTFGIPGVHNTELYDELNNSDKISPILVTQEGLGTFMADGVSRTSSSIGTTVIVPAAGTAYSMSGIGEAFLDGIPLIVISGGTRQDSGRHYQLHQLDQEKMVGSIVKKFYRIKSHEDIVSTIYEAYHEATSGEPGPVFIEIPFEFQVFRGEVSTLPEYTHQPSTNALSPNLIESTVDLLLSSKNPCFFVGWGAVEATEEITQIAEILGMPVSTTLQGLSAFPSHHPLHVGMGFSPSSPPAAQNAFKKCDCLLAVGVRFSELSTGSYGVVVPENLIHVDINSEVFNKNYKAKIALEGDAKIVLCQIINALKKREITFRQNHFNELSNQIQKDKNDYFSEWTLNLKNDKVSPGHFFKSLRKHLNDDAFLVVDDGKHTFLAAELFPVLKAKHFISPTDFNCMGYSIPAAIGVKLANREKQVAVIVGDGAFLMSGFELLTAKAHELGIMVFVFHDGELGQISQFQKIPLNRKTCSVLNEIKFEGVAHATGVDFISLPNDLEIDSTIENAIKISQSGQPVLVDVNIDYSKKTYLTKGVVKTNLLRFPFSEKVRFISRAIKRQVLG
jgi:acetolactate synthase-1/2/3 large subunit